MSAHPLFSIPLLKLKMLLQMVLNCQGTERNILYLGYWTLFHHLEITSSLVSLVAVAVRTMFFVVYEISDLNSPGPFF